MGCRSLGTTHFLNKLLNFATIFRTLQASLESYGKKLAKIDWYSIERILGFNAKAHYESEYVLVVMLATCLLFDFKNSMYCYIYYYAIMYLFTSSKLLIELVTSILVVEKFCVRFIFYFIVPV